MCREEGARDITRHHLSSRYATGTATAKFHIALAMITAQTSLYRSDASRRAETTIVSRCNGNPTSYPLLKPRPACNLILQSDIYMEFN